MKTIKEFIGDETIYDKENHIIRGLIYKYDGEDKQKIIKSQRIADVRGWRAIQNLFMNNDYIDLVSAEKFQDELGEFIAMSINEQLKNLNKMKKYPELRVVQVTYEGGDVITTSMAGTLTNKEIEEYFKIGRKFNIGSVKDKIRAVKSIVILK